MHRNARSSADRLTRSRFSLLCGAYGALFYWGAPHAQGSTLADDQDDLAIVVTATRSPTASFDLPASIDQISGAEINDGRAAVNLSETLNRVPGVVALNRQNYAQDVQISIRGFGARTSFGVRGLRLYEDGVPGTMPDGQGQISQFDLPSTARIEILRGPFSALYGNSSGGVISLFTEDGQPGTTLETDAEYGSFNTRHVTTKASGADGPDSYVIDAQEFATQGYREHSAAERRNTNAKLKIQVDDATELSLIVNTTFTPEAQDAQGLTRPQLLANPRQAGNGSDAFNTRKSVEQEQAGIVGDTKIDAWNSIHALVYGGHRATAQYQSIPLSTEKSPDSPGGVIALDRGYYGADVQWKYARSWLQIVSGLSFDQLDEARKGYLNYIGSLLGVEGALRRHEDNGVFDFDQYIQAEITPAPDLLLVGGMRHSVVAVSSRDLYTAPGVTSTSGDARYQSITPVGGVTWKLEPSVHLYASYGQGFETPTLNELAYRSTDGSIPGLNLGLAPSHSEDFEAGVKARFGDHARVELAGFHITTRGELAVEANSNGRSVYQNVGGTVRDGGEASFRDRWDNGIGVLVSATYIRATYSQNFKTCPVTPCAPVTIPAGTRLPGIPTGEIYGEVSWRDSPSGFSTALEASWRSRISVNDANSDSAAGAFVVNVRGGFEQEYGGWSLSEFLRIDNLADKRYVGSVIVNNSNGGYFEPAPGRAEFGGIKLAYRL